MKRSAGRGLLVTMMAAGLGFIPVQHEQYDFVIPKARARRPGVAAFVARLRDPITRRTLVELGMRP